MARKYKVPTSEKIKTVDVKTSNEWAKALSGPFLTPAIEADIESRLLSVEDKARLVKSPIYVPKTDEDSFDIDDPTLDEILAEED